MFRKSTALFVFLVASFVLPTGRLHAQTDNSIDIVMGPDPSPIGSPRPNAIVGSPLWLEMELAIMMAL